MAKISLRSYGKEIESLIDRGQYDQALAHCRHILRYYPKHIETYRLMAKAYLEATRYGDASDVFQRVLSSIPDDFVSQLGMSIIREDEGNLDAAIWHMERAFEIQPANVAIQSELRRLYGRRDGMEPPRVRLTRGALARMYLKGELFQQAISELRAALNTDASRTDLQVVLAQAYLRAGQRVEAADTCSSVLKKLPYCLEANRILAEIMSSSERAQDAAIYRQRAIAMNPYLGQLSPKATTPEQVPDEAVIIERLDLKADMDVSGEPSQPAWAASLGVAIEASTQKKEEVPDWLADLEGIAKPLPQDQSLEAPDTPKISPFIISEIERDELAPFMDQSSPTEAETGENLIPEWMKEAGWKPTKEIDEAAEKGFTLDEGSLPEDSGLAPAEIPSWLREMAPKEAFEEPEESLDVDARLVQALDSGVTPWLEETAPESGDPITTWLEGKDLEEPPAEVKTPGLPVGGVGVAAAGLAAWAARKDQEPTEEEQAGIAPAEPAEELTDWLPGAESGEAAPSEAEQIPSTSAGGELVWDELGSPEAATPAEIPEWLIALGPAVETHSAESTETADWLKELAPEGEEQAALGLESEPMPEWTEEVATAGEMAALGAFDAGEWSPESFEPDEETTSAELASSLFEPVIGPEAPPEQALPDWLREVNPEERVSTEETATEGEGSLPEWLRLMESGAEVGGVVAGAEVAGEWMPEHPSGEELSDLDWLEAEAVQPEALNDWLLAGEPQSELEGVETAAPPADLVGEMGEPRGWQAEIFTAQEPSPPGIEEAEIPDWLAESAAVEPEAPMLAEVTFAEQAPADEAPTDEAAFVEPAPPEMVPTSGVAVPLVLETAAGTDAIDLEAAQKELAETQEPQAAEEQPVEPRADLPAWLAVGLTAKELSESDQVPPEEPSQELEFSEDATQPTMVSPVDEAEVAAESESTETAASPVMSDEDAAFAWLESLAVKQGATEALMYSPEERQEEPPGWVKAETDQESILEEGTSPETGIGLPETPVSEAAVLAEPGVEPEEPPVLPDWLLKVAAAGAIADEVKEITGRETKEQEPLEQEVEEVGAVTEGAEPAMESPEVGDQADIDAAYAWLETLAVRQGADEALLLSPEERQAEPPDWVKAESESEAVFEAAGEIPVQVPEEMLLEEDGEVIADTPVTASTGLETEFSVEETQPVPEETLPVELAEPATLEAEQPFEAEPVPELPEWLADLEEESEAPVAETAWMPETDEMTTPVLPVEEVAPEEVMAGLEPITEIARLNINQASLIELERLPGVGFVRAQALLEHRQKSGPLKDMAELASVEGFDPELVDMLREYAEVIPQPEEVQPAAPGGVPVAGLEEARAALGRGDVEAALRSYQTAIHQTELLPEVIKDLNDALYRYPVDVSIWMTLGDAEMRSGRVQEALDAYTKAEELIR